MSAAGSGPHCSAPAGTRRRRRGWTALLAIPLLVGVAAWLVLRALVPPDPTWERIRATGLLRVCADPSWLPFESFNPDTGQIEGFDADLARLLAGRLVPGARAEFVTVGFDSLYDALIAGRCDLLLSALPYDPTRTRDVSYSVAYFNAGLVLVTRSNSAHLAALEDLPGRAVGVEWGFVPEGDRRQEALLRGLGLRRYDTAADALRAVQLGELDAALVDHISALVFLRQCPGLRIAPEPVSHVDYVAAVRPDSVRLKKELDALLLEMRRDGTLDGLREKWF